jgi:outer membrane biosynthesis protein TonB
MTNLGSILQTPDVPQSLPRVPSRLRPIEENGAQLLELRTDAGAVYVCPSRWQRIRLQWTFRHFHVLPPQLLSRSDQRLIKKLSQSAVVTPDLPVASDTVFGVVEKPRSKTLVSANRTVALRTELAKTHASPAKPEIPDSFSPKSSVGVKQRESREAPGGTKSKDVQDAPPTQWGALGALACVGVTVILASVYGILPSSNTGQVRNSRTPSTPIERAAKAIHPGATVPLAVSPATASLPKAEKPKLWVAPPPEPPVVHQESAHLADGSGQFISSKIAGGAGSASGSSVPTPDTTADSVPTVPSPASERRFVSDLPQGHFARPVVSERNLVGELQLKALIGADGSVKEVTVLSGSPKLAEAGMRAVRQWHYPPNQVAGSPGEMETRIKMSFYGEDGVSIASVANGPTQLR